MIDFIVSDIQIPNHSESICLSIIKYEFQKLFFLHSESLIQHLTFEFNSQVNDSF